MSVSAKRVNMVSTTALSGTESGPAKVAPHSSVVNGDAAAKGPDNGSAASPAASSGVGVPVRGVPVAVLVRDSVGVPPPAGDAVPGGGGWMSLLSGVERVVWKWWVRGSGARKGRRVARAARGARAEWFFQSGRQLA